MLFNGKDGKIHYQSVMVNTLTKAQSDHKKSSLLILTPTYIHTINLSPNKFLLSSAK
jgi:hypothetical protein